MLEKSRTVEALLKKGGEGYVYMGRFTYAQNKQPVLFILGTLKFYELNTSADLKEGLLAGRSYLSLNTVEESRSDPEEFVLHNVARAAVHVRGSSAADVTEAVVVFNAMVRDAWQRVCEATLLKSPEIYQFHSVVRKVNRKGKTQDRVLVVSKEYIYNIGSISEGIEEFKWSLPVESLLRVGVEDDEKAGYHSATFNFDINSAKKLLKQHNRKLGTKGLSINDKTQMLFVSQDSRNRCCMALCSLYHEKTGKKLAFARQSESIKNVRGSQLGVVKKEGVLAKYTRGAFGGIGKHERFIQIKSTGTICWGKTRASVSYFEKILAVRDQDTALSKFKLKGEESQRFLCVQTSGKTLYLLCPSIQEQKEWLQCCKDVLAENNG